MNAGFTYRALLTFLLLVTGTISVWAQQPVAVPVTGDTMRIVQIVKGNSLRQKFIDSTTLETIAGDVVLKEGLTLFYCDSAVINRRTNIMEAYGNIHINQNDSIHTYAQHMRYIGTDRIAYLDKDVRLTDKKGTLFTQELEYDLKTNIGKYYHGGKVVNGKTVLTSTNGVYYADTKDVYFKENVHLVDPKYDIKTDSLVYNTQLELVTFITGTYIKSKNGGNIYTTQGTYDLKNGKAFFGKRSVIKDSTRTYVADQMAYDENSGIAQLEGNAIVKDSVNGYSIIANQIFSNQKDQSFLATRKPVLIFKGEGNDSTYIAADTLFSGVTKKDSTQKMAVTTVDTLKQTTVISTSGDSVVAVIAEKDSLQKKDTVLQPIKKSKAVGDTLIRYFLAFHHVRVFNDSLQSVCDSLFYSSEDSVFRLYREPVVFSNKSQITGDTIYLYTKNRKTERVYVFENGLIINKANDQMYNQVGGRTINGYFKEGALDYMRVKGSPAESIFYAQDDDSAYIGMNRSKGDVIDVYFVNKEVNKVKFINDVDGTLFPLRQVPADQKYLRGFLWQDNRRPKNKFELFE